MTFGRSLRRERSRLRSSASLSHIRGVNGPAPWFDLGVRIRRWAGYAEAVPRRLLVVAAASVPAGDLRTAVRAHAGQDAEMLVVAPASDISRLDWLTNAEDDARTDAAERADELAEAAPTDDVKSRVGDSDPVQAIADALRTFPADELIVVTLPDEDTSWLEKESWETALNRFSLPVTHLVVEN